MAPARVAVYAYLLAVPWTLIFVQGLSGHDYARALQVLLFLPCAAAWAWAAWRCPPASAPASRPWRRAAAAGVACLVLASVLAADRPAWALREVALAAGLAAVAAVVAQGWSDRRGQALAAVVTAALGFYVALELLMVVLSLAQGQPLDPLRFSQGYDNRRFFNHVVTVALPLVAAWAGQLPSLRARQAGRWVVSGAVALTLFSGGRAVWIAQIVAALLFLAVFRRVGWLWLRALWRPVVGGVLLYGMLFVLLPWALGLSPHADWLRRSRDLDGAMSRWLLWKGAWAHWQASPVWGMGPMHFAHHMNWDAAHPHNLYVQLFTEWGPVPALAALLAAGRFMAKQLTPAVRAALVDRRQAPWAGGLWWALTAAAVDAALSGNAVMPVSQVWVAVAVGAALGWASPPGPGRPRGSRALATGALLLCGGLAAQTLLDLRHLPEVLGQSRAAAPGAPGAPRFWSQGWF